MKFPNLISGQLAQSTAVSSKPALYTQQFFEGYFRQTHIQADNNQRTWKLAYSNLNPDEAMRLRLFYESLPVNGEFSFADPWTGIVYPSCRLADKRLLLSCDKDNRFTVLLEIENAE